MKTDCRLPIADCRLPKSGGFSFSIANRKSQIKSAFTLLELLVVISILALLAALAVPAIKNLGKSNISISASRQLLDDLGHARQLAMANRTTVYMVFVPTNFWLPPFTGSATWTNNLTPAQFTNAVNLLDKQLTGYTFVSYGTLGDQPGRHQWHYLESWRSLPDGTFVAAQKFLLSATFTVPQWQVDYNHGGITISNFATVSVPFPETSTNYVLMPFVAFNYLGQLTFDGQSLSTRDEFIPLARGSVLPAIDTSTKTLQLGPSDVEEAPPGNSTNISYNLVHIDALTGRAFLEYHHVQ